MALYQSVIVLNHEWLVIRHWHTCDGVVDPNQYATATTYYCLIGPLCCEHGTLMHVFDHGITMQVQITARHWNEPMTSRQHHVVGCRYIASRPLEWMIHMSGLLQTELISHILTSSRHTSVLDRTFDFDRLRHMNISRDEVMNNIRVRWRDWRGDQPRLCCPGRMTRDQEKPPART